MRRLSAFLMITALLAVLVPSATLAGKPPPPSVFGVLVQGTVLLPNATGCALHMQVTWEGRAKYVYIDNGTGLPSSHWVVKADKSGAIATFDDIPLSYLNGTVTWSVYLTDRKLKPVSPTQLVSETFSGDACPAHGDQIARWPAL